MSKQHTATRNRAQISYVHRGVGSVVLRRFDPACDSFEELTQMLHWSFARLGSMGLNCTCVDQSALVTRARAMRGGCYVAVCNGRLVGTMALYTQDSESLCGFYRWDDIASVRQFGVDPAYQSRGIGKSLLAYADHWAAICGYAELALDTPQPAAHLIEFYRGQSFQINDFVRFAGKQYDSAILSKTPIAFRHFASWSRRLELPQASVARAACIKAP